MSYILRKDRVLTCYELCTWEQLTRTMERAKLAPIGDGLDERALADAIDKALIDLAESTRLRDAPLWLLQWWANTRMRSDGGSKFIWEEGATNE